MKEINFLKSYNKDKKLKIYLIIIVLSLIILTSVNIFLNMNNIFNSTREIINFNKKIIEKENILELLYIEEEEEKNSKDLNYSLEPIKYVKEILDNIPSKTYISRIYIDNNGKVVEGESRERENVFIFKDRLNYKINNIVHSKNDIFKYTIENYRQGDNFEKEF